MSELERDAETLLDRQVRKRGGITRKWSSQNVRGVPDRIVIIPDHPTMLVEMKAPFGKLSPTQASEIRQLVKLGRTVYVIFGKVGVREWLAALDDGTLNQTLPELRESEYAGATVFPVAKRLS